MFIYFGVGVAKGSKLDHPLEWFCANMNAAEKNNIIVPNHRVCLETSRRLFIQAVPRFSIHMNLCPTHCFPSGSQVWFF